MLILEKAKTLIRQKASVKDHAMSFSYTRWAVKLLTLVELEATGLFRTDLIINLNSPFSGKGKRDYSVQDVGMIIIWQEINVLSLVQCITKVAKMDILVPTVLQSLYMQCLLAIQKRKLPAFWEL